LSEVGPLNQKTLQEIIKGVLDLFRRTGQQEDISPAGLPKSRTADQNQGTLDDNKIDEAALALLYLGLHDETRAWKGFDWQTMNRLHAKGYISDPRGKAKSVVFTEDGLEEARRLLIALFSSE
jgi:hypothetical protein